MNKQTTRSTSDDLTPYVEFKDLPDTTTPIDATNLNNLQVQIKQDIADNRSVPSGGTTGQVLKKTSDTDYDIEWANETSQVVDNLYGNATDKAPSQGAVHETIGDLSQLNTTDKSSIVSSVNELSYNLESGGNAVPTGRRINGKIEYVKRFDCGALPNADIKYIPTGLDLNSIIFTGMFGVAINDNKTFAYFLPNTITNEVAVRFENSSTHPNRLVIVTSTDRSAYTESYVDISFIYR